MIRRTLTLATALVLALACDKEKPLPAQATTAAPEAPASTSKVEAPVVEEKFGVEQKQLEKDARALFATWLQAQNSGNFKQYSELYDSKFQGVKRIGNRVFQYDHAGWLQDRESLFSRPVTVTESDVTVMASGVSAVIQFKQTWQTPTFKDVGVKQLVLAKGPAGLRIAREEMLTSQVGSGAETVSALTKDHFLLHRAEGRLFVVASHSDPHDFEKIVGGHPRFIDLNTAIRPVNGLLLSPELKTLRDGGFTLFGASGELCAAKVSSAAVLVKVIPHFGQVQEWTGEGGKRAVDKVKVALDLWRMTAAGNGRSLAFELEKDPACEGAFVARSSAAPAAQVSSWQSTTPTPQQVTAGLTKMRALPAYREIQKQFAADTGKTSPWDSYDGGKPKLQLFQNGQGSSYLLIDARAGAGCGDFFGDLFTIWKLQPTPVLAASGFSGDSSKMPQAVLDLDADGGPEFVTEDLLFIPQGNTVRVLRNVSAPNFDCGC